jgi:hypothetical protein
MGAPSARNKGSKHRRLQVNNNHPCRVGLVVSARLGRSSYRLATLFLGVSSPTYIAQIFVLSGGSLSFIQDVGIADYSVDARFLTTILLWSISPERHLRQKVAANQYHPEQKQTRIVAEFWASKPGPERYIISDLASG